VAAAAALVLLGFFAWRARRRVPAAWLGFVFVFAGLAITANVFFPIGTIAAERFLYVPSLGWCIAAAPSSRSSRASARASSVAVLLLFAVRTWIRNDDWHDDYRLFTRTVVASPQSARAQSNAGAVHAQRGEFDVALEHYTRATEIRPAFAQAQLGAPTVLEILGRPENALGAYAAARDADPTNVETLLRSGDLLVATGKPARPSPSIAPVSPSRRTIGIDPGTRSRACPAGRPQRRGSAACPDRRPHPRIRFRFRPARSPGEGASEVADRVGFLTRAPPRRRIPALGWRHDACSVRWPR
jgi:tetratricopeptide (TPR) repeat protein